MVNQNYLTAFIALCLGSTLAYADNPWESDYRLPQHVVPDLYNLLLYPNLDEGKFSGKVEILLNITLACNHIYLHSKDLSIAKTSLVNVKNDETDLVKNAFAYPKNEFWVIELTESIEKGQYKLCMEFSGSLDHGGDMLGFYKSTYKNEETGQNRSLATTQFEPTSARKAYPCFDEPIFKVKYNIKLVRPSEGNFVALSNMNQEIEEVNIPSEGLTTVTFATSVPMSSYLSCFIVCDFEKLPSKKSKHGFDVTAYARNGQIKKMKFALENTVTVVDFYIEYFSIDYPLPKLDIIAIPDFSAGAMENWGLITFRETSVFYDPEHTTGMSKIWVTETTSHELAHQWFGNLVTMKWWDDLWLNEGFASFMSFKGSSHAHPDWDMETVFIWYYVSEALHLDSKLSSHPIIKHVAHPDQISDIFDTVSYAKGASVLRMLETFMGEENFRKGIVSYLKTFSFSNAETKDLWAHLDKYSSGVNVERVMDTWTRQMGAPVLIVTQDGQSITVKQERFTTDIKATYKASEAPYKYKWDVPVTYITSKNKIFSLKWLLLEDESVNIDIEDAQWYKLNWHFTGYYRVLYPAENYKALTQLLTDNVEALDAADRVNLIDDAFSLAQSGHLDYNIVLSLITYLQKEDHFVVWARASDNLLRIEALLRDTPIHEDYKNYLKKIIQPLIKDSLWDFSAKKSIFEKSLQVRLLSLACRLEIPECLQKAKDLFIDWLENNGPKPNVEIQYIVYYYGIAESGEEQWNKFWDKFVAEADPQEKATMTRSLCGTKDADIMKRLLELAKDEQYIRSQNYFTMIYNAAANPKTNPVVWDWIRENFNYLVDRFSFHNTYFGAMTKDVVGSYATEEKLKEVEEFISKYPEDGAGTSAREEACETIKLNILWRENHLPTITTWLQNNN